MRAESGPPNTKGLSSLCTTDCPPCARYSLAPLRGFKRGLPLDRMREAAAEAGYLGADTTRAIAETTIQDLLDALYSDEPMRVALSMVDG